MFKLHYLDRILDGEEGQEVEEEENRPRIPPARSTVSAREFAAFRLHVRKDTHTREGTRVFCLARLTEEWIVDVDGTIQGQRLAFHYENQDKYRSHTFRVVRDATVLDDVNIANMGRRVILPSSFITGPKHMHQLYQDAMGIVRAREKPNYFLTMTYNPHWPEIQRELLARQTWSNRPNLVARVFRLKQKALLDLIMSKGILKKMIAKMYTIEF
jgi:hypothetical protein